METRHFSYRYDPAEPAQEIKTDRPRLSDSAYEETLRSTVISCVDIALTVPGDTALWLAQRIVHPHPRPWVLGGRINFNDDTLEIAAAACLKREAAIIIDPTRFDFLLVALYAWHQTKQGDFPCKNLVTTFHLEITTEERDHIASALVESEYLVGAGLERYERARLIEENCHDALVRMYDLIYPN